MILSCACPGCLKEWSGTSTMRQLYSLFKVPLPPLYLSPTQIRPVLLFSLYLRTQTGTEINWPKLASKVRGPVPYVPETSSTTTYTSLFYSWNRFNGNTWLR